MDHLLQLLKLVSATNKIQLKGVNLEINAILLMVLGARPAPVHEDPHAKGPPPGRFGASATAKISMDASLAGAIIGKGGVNSKHICHTTGAKLAIRDHDSDPNSENIKLEGTFNQIKQATQMVCELIANVTPASNFKTKVCENFVKGSCTFGDRCHFAHEEEELRL
ncbi:unnamed protein product [Coffea canephora]|uniref:C3H1-type domain-containing protein n=1 Tax=Coffea canephora TaxID=49390 RepID=A0A068V7K9_COFCA|nr:unnamed protein product [Coffea canephora]